MKDQKFNAKKFLKSIKHNIGKRAPEAEEKREDDLDSLNEEPMDEGEGTGTKSKRKKEKVFDRVGGFFDPEPQRERVLSKEDFRGAGDVYFATVSAFYKVIERILWVLLILFLVFSLLTNYKEITFNNFFYLLKDFSSAVDSETSNYQILSYDSDKRQKFALFRGGIASASPSSISVFTTSGRRSLRSNNEYYSPNIVACDKYILVYDSASSSFSLYNSFSKVYNEKLEDPITDASFAEDGSFAVATRQADMKTIIYFYNKNIKESGYVSQSDYVFDMALSSAEHKLATIAYDVGGGTGQTIIKVSDIKNKNVKPIQKMVADEFPLSCAYLENGYLAVVTNSSIRIFDKELDEVKVQRFYEATVTAFNVSRNGATAVISSGSVRTVYAFDSKGNLAYNKPIGENVTKIDIVGKYLFLQTSSGVIRIDTDNKTRQFLSSNNGAMLVYSEDTAIVCGEAKAEYLVFE